VAGASASIAAAVGEGAAASGSAGRGSSGRGGSGIVCCTQTAPYAPKLHLTTSCTVFGSDESSVT